MSFAKEKFEKVVYFAHGGVGGGQSAADPKPIVDSDVMAIEAGMVVQAVSVIVSTSITGTTAVDIGDDDDPDGFVATAALTSGSSEMNSGAYLSTYGLQKAYLAAGKEVKLDATGASTAGAFAVVVQGFKM